jgi:hypothetical protein
MMKIHPAQRLQKTAKTVAWSRKLGYIYIPESPGTWPEIVDINKSHYKFLNV